MTPDDYRRLTPENRTKLFVALATARYGKRFQTALARDFEVDRTSVWRWVNTDTVPPAPLYALAAWASQPQSIASELRYIAGVNRSVAATAAALADRLSEAAASPKAKT